MNELILQVQKDMSTYRHKHLVSSMVRCATAIIQPKEGASRYWLAFSKSFFFRQFSYVYTQQIRASHR